jgi:hypothetical protein
MGAIMNADLKTIKHYLELALRGRPIDVNNPDIRAELEGSFQGLSDTLESLDEDINAIQSERNNQ